MANRKQNLYFTVFAEKGIVWKDKSPVVLGKQHVQYRVFWAFLDISFLSLQAAQTRLIPFKFLQSVLTPNCFSLAGTLKRIVGNKNQAQDLSASSANYETITMASFLLLNNWK